MIEQKKFISYNAAMMKKTVFTLIAMIFFGSAATAANYRAVDGDSLEEGERRIRLDGIDAPEFVQMCYTADDTEYACGLEALQYLEKLLENSTVRCDCLINKDKYGREVCECFADDISLNRAMVFGGYAVTYRSDKYIEDETNAKTNRRGIWQGRFMRPALYRALERIKNKNTSDG